MYETIVDFSKPAERQQIVDHVRSLTGKQRISIVRYSPRRTDRQNRMYWPCFVKVFAEYLGAQGNDRVSLEAVHNFFKAKFSPHSATDKNTGEVYDLPMGTSEMSVSEFNEYLDRIAAFMRELNIRIPDPEIYRNATLDDGAPEPPPFKESEDEPVYEDPPLSNEQLYDEMM